MQFCRLVTPRGAFKEGKNCLLPVENVFVDRDFFDDRECQYKIRS